MKKADFFRNLHHCCLILPFDILPLALMGISFNETSWSDYTEVLIITVNLLQILTGNEATLR